jgi:hypothetical protein
MEPTQEPLEKFRADIPKLLLDYLKLSKMERLRYPSAMKDLQRSSDLASKFDAGFRDLATCQDDLTLRHKTLAEQVKTLAAKFESMRAVYQERLDTVATDLDTKMDAQYDAYYRQLAEGVALNQNAYRGRSKQDLNTANASDEFLSVFMISTVPTDNFFSIRAIKDKYDQLIDEAKEMWKMSQDTPLDVSRLYGVILKHSVMYKDEKGVNHVGGKRGKVNTDNLGRESVTIKPYRIVGNA